MGIYTRVEQRDHVTAPPNVFGQAFADAVTKTAVGASPKEMFYSIMTVQLGGLKLMVRGEVDACEYDLEGLPESEAIDKSGEGMGFFGSSTQSPFQYVVQGCAFKGTLVEVKSKRAKYERDIDWEAYFMQMLFSGARKLVLGLHEKGQFKVPKEYTFEEVWRMAHARRMANGGNLNRDLAR